MIEPVVIAGGTRVLIDRMPGSRSASVGFWFPVGSRFESSSERGFTHFVEHMLFKGTSRRSARDIAREIDRVGGYLNAFTERDAVCFHCTLPAERVSLAVDVLADMVFDSTFPESEFIKEQQVIANEILAAEDDPEDYSNDEYLKTVWPGSGMSRKIAGETDDVLKATRDSVAAYWARNFVPASLVVTVAGNVSSEGFIEGLVRALPRSRAAATSLFDPAPVFKKTGRYVRCSGQQVHVYAGAPILPPFGAAEYNALSIASCAFGESMSSRLFQELREARGLCYSAFSWAALASDSGLFSVYGATSPSQYRDFLDALASELRRLASSGLTSEEIEEAKCHLHGSSVVAFEDVETRMKRLARQWFYDGNVRETEESLSSLGLTTPDDVNEVLRERILSSGYFSVLAYGPRPKGVTAPSPIDL